MKTKRTYSLIFILFGLLVWSSAFASSGADYSSYFKVDLDAEVPDLKALSKEYEKKTEVFNPRYVFYWDLGNVFDPVWRRTIKEYGLSETRLKNPSEEYLLDAVKALPKAYYPYVGPVLHASRGVSEKILNMPGIKETKNKFPERIAPELADIEDLEFLSPSLYLLLMPEVWPSHREPLESVPVLRGKRVRAPFKMPDLENVLQDVPHDGYGSQEQAGHVPDKDDLHTLNITENSPLTRADMKSFLQTLPALESFASPENMAQIRQAETLLDFFEEQNGQALPINSLKDMVNPCARFALKVKWAGLETAFYKAVAKQGFNLKEWAYTCDKTVKAYRVANVSTAMLSTLRSYKQNYKAVSASSLKDFYKNNQLAQMAATLEMYRAPKADVLLALKNGILLKKMLGSSGKSFLFTD